MGYRWNLSGTFTRYLVVSQAILTRAVSYPVTTWAPRRQCRADNARKIQIFWTGAISRDNASLCRAPMGERSEGDLLSALARSSRITCVTRQLRNHIYLRIFSPSLRIIRYYRGITRPVYKQPLFTKVEARNSCYVYEREGKSEYFIVYYLLIYNSINYIVLYVTIY